MELRGERECQDCGRRWSYFVTESVSCPDCGSVHSVGVGDRAQHTGRRPDLDLAAARSAVDREPLSRVAELAAESAREYRSQSGFVVGGDLRSLADEDLLATEIEALGTTLSRAMRVDDEQEHYFLSVLRGTVDRDRPGPDEVPASLAPERGLAVARVVGEYHSDLRTYLGEPSRDFTSALSGIRARRKRIEALDGDVEPRYAERLVGATRDLYAYLECDDEAGLARIDERLGTPR